MKMPARLEPLVGEGVIEEVIRPLKSGKEAQIFLVLAGGQERVAKVYKEQNRRSFSQRAEYTEGRSVRNTRDRRAMEKRTNYGRAQEEEQWRCVEADTIYTLRDAGVRVPEPFIFMDGVLVMELVKDTWGNPAPRLSDVSMGIEERRRVFHHLLNETARMLSADIVHGDLSIYNVLYAADGPVIIDFPQAVNSSANSNAKKILIRDVQSLASHFLRDSPNARKFRFGEEIWRLYERGELSPGMDLTRLMDDAHAADQTEEAAQAVPGLNRRTVVIQPTSSKPKAQQGKNPPSKGGRADARPENGSGSHRRRPKRY